MSQVPSLNNGTQLPDVEAHLKRQARIRHALLFELILDVSKNPPNHLKPKGTTNNHDSVNHCESNRGSKTGEDSKSCVNFTSFQAWLFPSGSISWMRWYSSAVMS